MVAEEAHGLQRANATLAVNVILHVRIQLGEVLPERAQRHERHALDVRDLVFVEFAHVDDLDAALRLVERLLHFLHGHLVGIPHGHRGFRRDAAELFVINQRRDRRLLAADRALRIAPQTQLAELHVERVEQQQTPHERSPLAQRELQNLRRLNAPDDARQHPQHAALGAARHHPRRRRLGIKAAVTRPAQVRREDTRLSVEAENRPVNIGLLQDHARVVREVARREIVRAIHDDVVLPDDLERVLAAQAHVVAHDFHVRIDLVDRLLGRLGFRAAHIARAVNDLPLKVREIHRVEIDEADFANARRREIHRNRRTQPARTDAQHARRADFFLPGHAHFREDEVARVAADFVVVQLHNFKKVVAA